MRKPSKICHDIGKLLMSMMMRMRLTISLTNGPQLITTSTRLDFDQRQGFGIFYYILNSTRISLPPKLKKKKDTFLLLRLFEAVHLKVRLSVLSDRYGHTIYFALSNGLINDAIKPQLRWEFFQISKGMV